MGDGAQPARLEEWPINIGLQANARDADDAALDALLDAGALGFKIHEDYGAYPELIDHVLRYADAHDVTSRCTPTASTSRRELEDTVAAIDGRTVHAYHVEGAGGGHVPDVIGLVREPTSSARRRRPRSPSASTPAEHVPDDRAQPRSLVDVPGDVELARERVRAATMAAEGPLHELGAIAITNSDSQGMGRIGETLRDAPAGPRHEGVGRPSRRGIPGLPADPGLDDPDDRDDNARVLRYLAK